MKENNRAVLNRRETRGHRAECADVPGDVTDPRSERSHESWESTRRFREDATV